MACIYPLPAVFLCRFASEEPTNHVGVEARPFFLGVLLVVVQLEVGGTQAPASLRAQQ
jgi:hypothetical protein